MKAVLQRSLLILCVLFLCIGTGGNVVEATGAPDICPITAQYPCVELVGQLGGAAKAVAVQDYFAYVGVGPRVIVLDISTPSQPRKVGETAATFPILADLEARGDYLYAVGGLGLQVMSIADPANPVEVGRYDTPGNALDVAIDGDYTYVADSYGGLQIIDIADPHNPTRVGFYDSPQWTSGVAVSGDYAYVAADKLLVLNIADPANPTEVGSFTNPPSDVYRLAVRGDYVYMTDSARGGLHIVNVSNASNPTLVGIAYTGYSTAIILNGNYAYLTDRKRLFIVSIADPANPTVMGIYDVPGVMYSRNVAVSGDHVYVAHEDAGLRIVNVSDPSTPFEVSSYDNGLEWAEGIAVDGDYAYVADMFAGLRVVDMANPASPIEVGSYDTPGHAMGVTVGGDYLYVADQGAGVRVMRLTDPRHPVEVGFHDTPGTARRVTLSGDYAYVADTSAGLRVLSIADPVDPTEVGFYLPYQDVNDVVVSGDYAYLANGPYGLRVVNITDKTKPVSVGVGKVPGYIWDVAVSGHYAYITGFGGLHVMAIEDPANPSAVLSLHPFEEIHATTLSGENLYFGSRIVSVANPIRPTVMAYYGTPTRANDIVVQGDIIYVADGNGGLFIFKYLGANILQPSSNYLPLFLKRASSAALNPQYPERP